MDRTSLHPVAPLCVPAAKITAIGCGEQPESKPRGLQLSDCIAPPAPFDGENADAFSKFHRDFSDILEIYEVSSDENKLSLFAQLLQGAALKWYTSFLRVRTAQNGGQPPSFQEVEAAAIHKYVTIDNPYDVWCRLVNNYQDGDSAEYAERHEKLARDVKLTFSSAQQITLMEFIRGLPPEIALIVSRKHPQTLREAQRFALLQEYVQRRGSDTGGYSQRSRAKRQRYNNRGWGKATSEEKAHCHNCRTGKTRH